MSYPNHFVIAASLLRLHQAMINIIRQKFHLLSGRGYHE